MLCFYRFARCKISFDHPGMDIVKVFDKTFRLSIPERDILDAVDRIAGNLNRDFHGKDPLFIAVLNGAFIFASDLFKRLDFPCSISFVKLASYEGSESSGLVKKIIGLNESIQGREVVVIEDIIDTGISMKSMIRQLEELGPENIHIASLLFKPDAFQEDFTIDYIGLNIPNDFIVGYGLDYNGYGRNLKGIFTIV